MQSGNSSKFLNIGCGQRFHHDWINVDVVPAHPSVIQCDVQKGIPYPDNFFDVVYHSHVLEHFERRNALLFIKECRRVLKPGGLIRIAVPDLEEIARSYLEAMEKAFKREQDWQDNYDWIMLELYDQAVRTRSGGEMFSYLGRNELPNREFLLQRGGIEIRNIIERRRKTGKTGPNENQGKRSRSISIAGLLSNPRAYLAKKKEHLIRYLLGPEYDVLQIGRFRKRGEVHLWMYDRYSLGKLLQDSGFLDPEARSASESAIPGWSGYQLDTEPDGSDYKPGSLYMEAMKPGKE
jgi:predicted SAM-dependent methyltransferase